MNTGGNIKPGRTTIPASYKIKANMGDATLERHRNPTKKKKKKKKKQNEPPNPPQNTPPPETGKKRTQLNPYIGERKRGFKKGNASWGAAKVFGGCRRRTTINETA